MSKYVIDYETAEEEFNNFCDAWELDNEESVMSENDKTDFKRLKNQIIKAIRKGRLCMKEDETLEYIISEKTKNEKKSGQNLTIRRPSGETYLAMDKYKEGQGVHKFNAVLANMSGHAPAYFSDFDGIDLKPLQAIVTLFLAD